eukprot:m.199044 g.199044  ORF g.199044 m.199044 type:complete len:1096 (+) comp16840_c3_seq12:1584-4871(+)
MSASFFASSGRVNPSFLSLLHPYFLFCLGVYSLSSMSFLNSCFRLLLLNTTGALVSFRLLSSPSAFPMSRTQPGSTAAQMRTSAAPQTSVRIVAEWEAFKRADALTRLEILGSIQRIIKEYPTPAVVTALMLRLSEFYPLSDDITLKWELYQLLCRCKFAFGHLDSRWEICQRLRRSFLSNDATDRVITLRIFTLLAPQFAGFPELHYDIITGIASHHEAEAVCAVVALSAFARHNDQVCETAFDKVAQVISDMKTTPRVRAQLLHFLRRTTPTPLLVNRAVELCWHQIDAFCPRSLIEPTFASLEHLMSHAIEDARPHVQRLLKLLSSSRAVLRQRALVSLPRVAQHLGHVFSALDYTFLLSLLEEEAIPDTQVEPETQLPHDTQLHMEANGSLNAATHLIHTIASISEVASFKQPSSLVRQTIDACIVHAVGSEHIEIQLAASRLLIVLAERAPTASANTPTTNNDTDMDTTADIEAINQDDSPGPTCNELAQLSAELLGSAVSSALDNYAHSPAGSGASTLVKHLRYVDRLLSRLAQQPVLVDFESMLEPLMAWFSSLSSLPTSSQSISRVCRVISALVKQIISISPRVAVALGAQVLTSGTHLLQSTTTFRQGDAFTSLITLMMTAHGNSRIARLVHPSASHIDNKATGDTLAPMPLAHHMRAHLQACSQHMSSALDNPTSDLWCLYTCARRACIYGDFSTAACLLEHIQAHLFGAEALNRQADSDQQQGRASDVTATWLSFALRIVSIEAEVSSHMTDKDHPSLLLPNPVIGDTSQSGEPPSIDHASKLQEAASSMSECISALPASIHPDAGAFLRMFLRYRRGFLDVVSQLSSFHEDTEPQALAVVADDLADVQRQLVNLMELTFNLDDMSLAILNYHRLLIELSITCVHSCQVDGKRTLNLRPSLLLLPLIRGLHLHALIRCFLDGLANLSAEEALSQVAKFLLAVPFPYPPKFFRLEADLRVELYFSPRSDAGNVIRVPNPEMFTLRLQGLFRLPPLNRRSYTRIAAARLLVSYFPFKSSPIVHREADMPLGAATYFECSLFTPFKGPSTELVAHVRLEDEVGRVIYKTQPYSLRFLDNTAMQQRKP